jgi:hypothetical protein
LRLTSGKPGISFGPFLPFYYYFLASGLFSGCENRRRPSPLLRLVSGGNR